MITEVTRRRIFDFITVNSIVWSGSLSETDFLSRIFNLEKLPSTDGRFKNAWGDIHQHRINNPYDWEDDWIFFDSRFNLLEIDDLTFLKFLSEMVHPVVRRDQQEIDSMIKKFNEYLVIDGYELIKTSDISGWPVFSGRKFNELPISLKKVKDKKIINLEYINKQIERIEQAISSNPDLAIGTSKELIETCCKTILEENYIELGKDTDVTKLVKETCKILKLTPEDIPDSVKASSTIKRLLNNLASISQSLSELRNAYGTGHGKSANYKGLSPRHARLAAGAATTLVLFIYETYTYQKEKTNY